MKESTINLIACSVFILIGIFAESVQAAAFYGMAFFALLTSCICRAIERNGKER